MADVSERTGLVVASVIESLRAYRCSGMAVTLPPEVVKSLLAEVKEIEAGAQKKLEAATATLEQAIAARRDAAMSLGRAIILGRRARAELKGALATCALSGIFMAIGIWGVFS